jgi:hypothetical protein
MYSYIIKDYLPVLRKTYPVGWQKASSEPKLKRQQTQRIMQEEAAAPTDGALAQEFCSVLLSLAL